jgi:cytochrome P450
MDDVPWTDVITATECGRLDHSRRYSVVVPPPHLASYIANRSSTWHIPSLALSALRGAYFPFLAGTRKCLGDQFALLEAHIILMEMARTKRPKPLSPDIPKAEPRATFRPHGDVPSLVVAAV